MARRDSAIRRGLAFIYQSACEPENFYSCGADYLCCFYCISATSSDPDFRQLARTLGKERARKWRQHYPNVPHDATAEDVVHFVFGSDAADRLGERHPAFKKDLRRIAGYFNNRDYLFFDPIQEPPPTDVPLECDCGAPNPRGQKICRKCKNPLSMMSAYWVWLTALTRSYTGERYGIRLGASFADVLKWLPAMRPYPNPDKGDGWDFYWAIYAVTHLVYTLNDYSFYQLSPAWLPNEYAFLKRNLARVMEMDDPEILGELVDSLKAFGLPESNITMRRSLNYLLSSQNEDGSWGNPEATDIYERYHPTWTAIDGLREYAWRGERLSLPRLWPLIEPSAKKPASDQ